MDIRINLSALILAALMLFSSCSENSAEDPDYSDKTEQTSVSFSDTLETSEAETESTEVTEKKKYQKPAPALAEFESENPLMQSIARLTKEQYEKYPDSDFSVSSYVFCDADGDNTDEILITAPYEDKLALYMISSDGKSDIFPIEYSEGTKDLYSDIETGLFANGKPYIKFYVHTSPVTDNTFFADADKGIIHPQYASYYYICLNETVKTFTSCSWEEKSFQYEDGASFNQNWHERVSDCEKEMGVSAVSLASEMSDFARFYSSPEELEEAAVKRLSSTSLERAREYAEECGGLLYDLTGDDFPEMIEIFGGYMSDYEFTVSDMSRGFPVNLYSGCLDRDGKIYFGREGDIPFIAVAYLTGGYSHFELSAERCDFYGNGVCDYDIGGAKVYYLREVYEDNGERKEYSRCYNSGFGFEGSNAQRLCFYDVFYDDRENFSDPLEKQFYDAFESYISGYEIIDEISFDSEKGIITKKEIQPFADLPGDSEIRMEEKPVIPMIDTGWGVFPADSKHIYVYADELNESFDSDILNEFEDLTSVSFDGSSDFEGHIAVKQPSDWCSKISYLEINTDIFTFEGDWSCFENVKSLRLNGNIESFDFIKEMRNIEVFYPPYAYEMTLTDKDMLLPLTELPKLAVIADSGHCSFLEGISDDERSEIYEMLDGCIWVYLK